MRKAFLPAFLPRFFRQRVFVELIRAGAADPDLFGIEDEDAGNSGDSLFDACQGG
jgi:hypothetical protein